MECYKSIEEINNSNNCIRVTMGFFNSLYAFYKQNIQSIYPVDNIFAKYVNIQNQELYLTGNVDNYSYLMLPDDLYYLLINLGIRDESIKDQLRKTSYSIKYLQEYHEEVRKRYQAKLARDMGPIIKADPRLQTFKNIDPNEDFNKLKAEREKAANIIIERQNERKRMQEENKKQMEELAGDLDDLLNDLNSYSQNSVDSILKKN